MIRPATDHAAPYAALIPSALVDAGIGVVSALATTRRSGLNTHLLVRVDLDHDALTAEELRRLIAAVVAHADMPASFLDLLVRGPGGEDLDLVPLIAALGARPIRGAFTGLRMADARAIADGGVR